MTADGTPVSGWEKANSAWPVGVSLVLRLLIGYRGLAPLPAGITPLFLRRTGVPSIARGLRRQVGPYLHGHSKCGGLPFCMPGLGTPQPGLGP
jgi:hypothetical protein